MPLSGITWLIEADFDRDGSYTSLNSYATTTGFSLSIDRESSYEGSINSSQLNIVLRNINAAFSMRNSSGSFYGSTFYRVPIRVKATFSAVTYTLWTGYIVDYDYTFSPGNSYVDTISLTCTDLLGIIKDYTTTISQTSTTTAASLSTSIFTDIGISEYSVTSSNSITVDNFYANREVVGTVLKDLAMSDLNGWVWCDKSGNVRYDTRDARLGITSPTTWGDGTVIIPNNIEEKIENKVANKAEVTTTSYDFDSNAQDGIIFKALIGADSPDKHGKLLHSAEVWEFQITPNVPGVISFGGTATCTPDDGYACAGTDDITKIDTAETKKVLVTISSDYKVTVINASNTDTYLMKLQIKGVPIYEHGALFSVTKSGTTSMSSTIGTVSWNNPSFAGSADGTNFASISFTSGAEVSWWLKGVSYGFSIPLSAVVDGLAVKLTLKTSNTLSVATGEEITVKAAPVISSTPVDPGSSPYSYYSPLWFASYDSLSPYFRTNITTLTAYTFGQISGLNSGNGPWGTYVPSDINDSGFGMAISVSRNSGATIANTFYVDALEVIVYYFDTTKGKVISNKNEILSLQVLPSIGSTKGGGSISSTLKWNGNQQQGQDYAMEKLRIYRYPFTRLVLTFKWYNDTIITQMLSLELGSLIFYKDTLISQASYSNDYYRVEAIRHKIGIGEMPETKVTLIPVYQYRNTLKIAWDDFTKTTNSNGDLGTTATGDTWANLGASPDLTSGQYVTISGSRLDLFPYVDIASYSMIVECSFTITSVANSSTNTRIGIVYNLSSSLFNCYCGFIKITTNGSGVRTASVGLGKGSTSNVSTFTGNELTSYQFKNTLDITSWTTSPLELKAISMGNRHRFYINGILFVDATDSSYTSGTYTNAGFILHRDSASTAFLADNFYAQSLS